MNFDRLKSRKLWVAVGSTILVSFGMEMGMSEEQVQSLVAIVVAYLLGQGIADHGKEKP